MYQLEQSYCDTHLSILCTILHLHDISDISKKICITELIFKIQIILFNITFEGKLTLNTLNEFYANHQVLLLLLITNFNSGL